MVVVVKQCQVLKYIKQVEGGDAFGDQLAKGFIHVIEGITPGASPFRVPVGSNFNDLEIGRFTRGVTDLGQKNLALEENSQHLGEMVRALLD